MTESIAPIDFGKGDKYSEEKSNRSEAMPVPASKNLEFDNVLVRTSSQIFIIGSMMSFLSAFVPQFAREAYVHIAIGTLSFAFGYLLIRVERSNGIIPQEDRILFGDGLVNNSDYLERHTALRQLVGIPGFFKNLGILGLPLATISITLLFCMLAIVSYAINTLRVEPIIPETFPAAILELSKLTLGVFIGSFVARASEQQGPIRREGS